jgi:excisionase family DNA binding protein
VPDRITPHATQLSLTHQDSGPEDAPPSRRANRQELASRTGAGPRRTDEPFYTVAELAARLALSERTVRDMLNRGEVPCYRIGPQRRIDPADLRRWLEQRRETR